MFFLHQNTAVNLIIFRSFSHYQSVGLCTSYPVELQITAYDNFFYAVSPALVNFSPSCNNTAHCLPPSALGEEAFLQREQKGYCLFGRGADDLVLADTFSIPTSQR